MYIKFLKNRTSDNEERYKKYKNRLTSVLRNCEKGYYSNLLAKYRNNIKETWKILNGIIKGKRGSSSDYPDSFIHANTIIKDKKGIVNGFNDFFVNVGPNLAAKIPQTEHASIYDYLCEPNSQSFFLNNTNEQEILNVVNNMNSKTSTDCNDVSMSVVKEVINVIVKPLTFIFNKSFMTGTFPDSMKKAKVIPIFKAGDKNIFTNYRPVYIYHNFQKF